MTFRILIQEGEGTTLEFKESLSSSFARELVALANTIGGKILLGVRDDGTVAGRVIEMTPEQREELVRLLQKGEELSPAWSRILFPPEKREYELVYHGLILVRELDERLGLGELIDEHLSDSRQGTNKQFTLADLLRQSVYSRLAGYEDLNDAERVSIDPTFRLIGSQKIWDRLPVCSGTESTGRQTPHPFGPSRIRRPGAVRPSG